MTILVFGCNGLLGQNILRTAPKGISLVCSGIEDSPVVKGDFEYCSADITSKEKITELINKTAPDRIINCAAMTNVDQCEINKAMCKTVNRDAVGWMAEPGIPMLHISTDYVFDGTSGPYKESDSTNPLGYYGKTKLESESLVLDQSGKSIIIRTMLLWGRGRGLKTSFVEFVKTSLEKGKPIRIVKDQYGSPTLAGELAVVIWKLIETERSGIYHVSGSESKSRFDWATQIAEFFNLDTSNIHPILTSELGQQAPRPMKTGFILDKMFRDTGIPMSGIRAQLQTAL